MFVMKLFNHVDKGPDRVQISNRAASLHCLPKNGQGQSDEELACFDVLIIYTHEQGTEVTRQNPIGSKEALIVLF